MYRDPWGNPCIITLDMNGDDRCRDGFYCGFGFTRPRRRGQQQGIQRMFKQGNLRDSYEYRGTVIVWSMGPDGFADERASANKSANKNILNWK